MMNITIRMTRTLSLTHSHIAVVVYGIKEPTVPPSGRVVIWQMELNGIAAEEVLIILLTKKMCFSEHIE